MHGLDFHFYLPPPGPPVLATLHLPPDWYPVEAWECQRPNTWLNCVSNHQVSNTWPNHRMLPPIPNGVPVRQARRRARAQMPLRADAVPGLPGEGPASRAAGRARRRDAAADRRRDLPLPGAPGLFHRRSGPAARPAAPLSRPARLHPQAPPACRRALPAGAEPGARDQLAGRDGGRELRHAGDRVPQRRAAGSGRGRADRLPRRRRGWHGGGDRPHRRDRPEDVPGGRTRRASRWSG